MALFVALTLGVRVGPMPKNVSKHGGSWTHDAEVEIATQAPPSIRQKLGTGPKSDRS
jgi:hypothetical protein